VLSYLASVGSHRRITAQAPARVLSAIEKQSVFGVANCAAFLTLFDSFYNSN
jgi:hypothetical protein